MSNTIDEAWLPADSHGKKRDKIRVYDHPKTPGRRMVEFLTVVAVNEDGELYGPERTVALDKIVRVKG